MDDYNLPTSYGKTRLVLLAVDLYLIHAYWELTPDRLIEAQEQAGESQPVLRLYKGGTAAEEAPVEWFDIDVDLKSRSWYVHLWSVEESYCGDLALKRKDGSLVRLARSEPVRMPRAQPAIEVTEHFMRVEAKQALAEIVPPPKRTDREPELGASAEKPIHFVRPPKVFDSAEVVKQKLERLYASLQSPPELSEGEPVGGPRDEAQSDLVAAPSVPPGEVVFDLTQMAEAKLADLPSSGALQRTDEGVGSDRKK
jgi:hypothetical protein